METNRRASKSNRVFPDRRFPTTRYQGSKRKLLPWIWEGLRDLGFDTALDLFGGTGVVSYLFKAAGKAITYNDYLRFNHFIGLAIIENACVRLSACEIDYLVQGSLPASVPAFIQDTFGGMYYTDEENRWLDETIAKITLLSSWNKRRIGLYKQALAYYALFQACLVKRPFNLFHRKNLYLRTANVARSFGNKTSWDTPFPTLFSRFLHEVNALVFDNGRVNRSINQDVGTLNESMDLEHHDLVYIDPPYISPRRSPTQSNYRRLYHFLEGIGQYAQWQGLIDRTSYNLRLRDDGMMSTGKTNIRDLFASLFHRFAKSIIVVSYKSPGIPSEDELVELLSRYKDHVVVRRLKYNYALNRLNEQPHENIELMLIAQ